MSLLTSQPPRLTLDDEPGLLDRLHDVLSTVNACDGEPLVAKDELLLAVHTGSRAEPYGRNLLAQNGHLWSTARLLTAPARYVSSEATALAALAAGRPARPQDREHPMTLGDRDGTSALVPNAETVAQVALLWAGHRGPLTRLVTVTGAVAAAAVLEVDDRTACQGYGLCAELLPERIELDEWGYPILDARPLPAGLFRHARRAAHECPVRALRLTRT